MIYQILILFFLLGLCSLFSASELSFITARKINIELKSIKKNLSASNALYFFKNARLYFLTILVGTSISQTFFAFLSSFLLATWFGFNTWEIVITVSLALIFIGEILPKYLVRKSADSALMATAVPVRVSSFILFPFIKILSVFPEYLKKIENIREENLNLLFGRNEAIDLIRVSNETGIVNKEETDILNRIIDLGDQRVYEVMRPRTDIVGVEITSSINEVLQTFVDSGYSKLPVYEDNLDNIKGIVFAYDLFKKPENLQSIIRNVIFVPDTKRTTEMLKEFSEKRTSFAVAVDEFGGTAGILTMEDIIEELLGEINDEYDTDMEVCKKVGDAVWVISGKTEIDYINEQFGLNLPEGDYSTMAGLITSSLGKIPAKGDIIKIGNFSILILRSSNVRIELVKLTILPQAE